MNLNYQAKTGWEITKGSGSDRWVSLRRFNEDGEFESLFVARFKYNKPGTKATRYVKQLIEDIGESLQHISQAELDDYREVQNNRSSGSFHIRRRIEERVGACA